MSINELMFRNLRKNLKNYSLYIFALIFSAALYFAFVTLQFDPAMDEAKGSVKGGASFKAASVILVAIVSIFLLYANTIFIKRRSKEIGLFQLIGMTKHKIFRILTAENFILYFGSLAIGIFAGFSASKLLMMMLLKVIGVDSIAELHFSTNALFQTLIVFSIIYLFIMLMNYRFIKRQTILSLFKVTSVAEERVKKMSIFEMVIGVLGMTLIAFGYYVSTKLFGGDFVSMNELFIAMIAILASVIVGTYLFYKGSVSFIFNLIRKKKNGHVSINDVMSLSSIMFRMKSNAVLLTIITTVSALALGLLSLSYISYYSAEASAKRYVPDDFSITNIQDANKFKAVLTENNLAFTEKTIEVIQADINIKNVMKTKLEEVKFDPNIVTSAVISETAFSDLHLSADETLLTKSSGVLQKFMSLKDAGPIELKGNSIVIPQSYKETDRKSPISGFFTSGGLPVAIVDDTVFHSLKQDLNPAIQKKSAIYVGISMKDKANVEKANAIFNEIGFGSIKAYDSQMAMRDYQKLNMGGIMFIVAFLGLTFLITSGCILYFKQVDESEEEKSSYTVLRKLGFTQGDLLKGIGMKQLFNFGIPLIVGLLHSYFAVQSGWFLFGTDLYAPMIIVMVLYTALYSVFGILSVYYYKKVIKASL
ncbi:ABC transporter permease [Paenibacillus sp. GSMTC-2017]|uniref:ABC transporter permease n=1 Tax=Paenibacillus sp. GSMTC-2017 TaxID=2794350 RepID=UPI0018D60AD8|nr:ABC transporter permease [Paenibacillus sp. GSMTC-2017]MBH5319916.1 ABC transporter permease [Paenibacillus sp. GSMTC-2017]